jgi:hypothetical protein
VIPLTVAPVVALVVVAGSSQPSVVEHAPLLAIVANIQRADYEANLEALRRHYDAIPVQGFPSHIEARLRYWKGFAMWRRAINGFNASIALGELASDTGLAVREFERAAELDPDFTDAKIAPASCYQEKAIATYARGLAEARRARKPSDALDPTWGEPELLMNLAWANLNRISRDLAAAESFARSALLLVPHWQYVRDHLLPQIVAAKR